MRIPRFSLLHLMVAVACVALLIPFPWRAIVQSFANIFVWYLVPIIFILWIDSLGKPRGTIATLILLSGLGSWLFSWRMGHAHPSKVVLEWATLALTPVHLIGPIYLARQYYRAKPITSGEILWGWMGVVWMDVFAMNRPRSPYGLGIVAMGEFLVELARLCAVLALCLACFGKRPTRPGPVWPYYVGWGLAECDVILWGWYAVNWYFPGRLHQSIVWQQ